MWSCILRGFDGPENGESEARRWQGRQFDYVLLV